MSQTLAVKWLKDKDDVNFFPVTHINAVRDADNNTISTLLDRKQDIISASNPLSYSYITGAPEIPTVNNGTLTITQNGTSLGTFSANSSSSPTIDITAISDAVVSGSYSSSTKKIILSLAGGTTSEIDISPLISGLQSEITSSNKISADLVSESSTNKFMTSTERTKLNGIANGAEQNVQSDWSVIDTSSDAYIANKPTIGNATVSITRNNVSQGSFTLNQTSDDSINIEVPTKTSDLTNDGDGTNAFLTSHQDISGKQDTLVSGTNIKTINNTSLLGSGNITTISPLIVNLSITSGNETDLSSWGDGSTYTFTLSSDTAQSNVVSSIESGTPTLLVIESLGAIWGNTVNSEVVASLQYPRSSSGSNRTAKTATLVGTSSAWTLTLFGTA